MMDAGWTENLLLGRTMWDRSSSHDVRIECHKSNGEGRGWSRCNMRICFEFIKLNIALDDDNFSNTTLDSYLESRVQWRGREMRWWTMKNWKMLTEFGIWFKNACISWWLMVFSLLSQKLEAFQCTEKNEKWISLSNREWTSCLFHVLADSHYRLPRRRCLDTSIMK